MCIKPQLARRKSRPISAKCNGVRQPRCLRPQQSSRVEVSKLLSSVRAVTSTSFVAYFWSSSLDWSERAAIGALVGAVLLIFVPSYAPTSKREH